MEANFIEEKSLVTLEFTKILKRLSEYAKNEDAKKLAENLKPSPVYREVEQSLLETDGAVTMSLKYGTPEILRFEPVEGSLKRLADVYKRQVLRPAYNPVVNRHS